jgi:exodeoxyribonuclease VIII
LDIGLEVTGSMVEWWLQQSEEARKALLDNPVLVQRALRELSEFIGTFEIKGVWGNGATFDNVILDNAYKAAQMNKPWKYYQDRCFRTTKAENQQILMEGIGVAHNALDDAKYQALYLIKLWDIAN